MSRFYFPLFRQRTIFLTLLFGIKNFFPSYEKKNVCYTWLLQNITTKSGTMEMNSKYENL